MKKTTVIKFISRLAAIFFVLAGLAPAAWSVTDYSADTAAKLEQQAALQAELKELEAQISRYQTDLNKIGGEKKTLQNKLNQLKKQQAKLTLEIKATALKIEDLNRRATATQVEIMLGEAESARLRERIGRLLSLIHRHDDYPLLYSLADGVSLSAFISASADYNKIIFGLSELLKDNRAVKAALSERKKILGEEQEEAENLLAINSLQQENIKDSAERQDSLLRETKGKESSYQSLLADTKKQAQAIKSRLYQLLDVPAQINFGQAVEIANWASLQTGVRAAFLLAILSQESNLGKNVGTCNRLGDPPEKSWKAIMNPTRDQPVFLRITEELGRNPDITPVSCPMRAKDGSRVGWGGAMGPAQFIPSTWWGYRDKITAVTGKAANPWDIRDAFLAAALKLAAGGATAKSGEWAAAMRYFSGSTNPKYSFYGDSVAARTADYQADIDQLNK